MTEVYSDYICVAWDEPEDNGGEEITTYTVQRKNIDKQSWIQVQHHYYCSLIKRMAICYLYLFGGFICSPGFDKVVTK